MERENTMRKRAPLLGGLLVVLILLSVMVWFVRGFMANKSQKPARTVQNITVIRPPPPPPPEETPPPPPPEKIEQPLPQNEPEPTPDNAQTPSPQLGLDADGAAGDDGFGLAARKGGSDIAGTGGAAFAWYTGKLKDEVNDRLSSDAKLRGKKFTVGIRIWLESDGRIKDVKMTSGTGNRDLDSAISSDIVALGRLSTSPPIEMPQPISLQIVSRS
jgi:protein TonB